METGEGSEANEELGAISSELGEIRCAEQACIASNSCTALTLQPNRCGYAYASATDSVPYGTFGCPQASTVSLTAPVGAVIRPFIQWADGPANCTSEKLDLTVHRRASSSVAWTSTIHRYHGVVVGDETFSFCQFELNAGYPAPPTITKTATNEIRLAGSAKVGSEGYRTVALGGTIGTDCPPH